MIMSFLERQKVQLGSKVHPYYTGAMQANLNVLMFSASLLRSFLPLIIVQYRASIAKSFVSRNVSL